MGTKPDIIAETGLQYFGKISASISHELKNVMAIVNENAGLLEDLTLMAEQGKPLDPARLKKMAAAVQKQVGRADAILNNMNRFSHSIDATVAEVDLNKTIELFMALTDRFIVMRGVRVDLQLPDRSQKIRTAPYFLINLLWLCLDFAMSACGDDKQLAIVAEETDNSLAIRFQGLTGIAEERLGAFPADREKSLLPVLEADLAVDPDRQEIVLRLSKHRSDLMTARVLLVDDEKDFLDIMAERMEARGMDVSTTTSAEHALKMVQSKSYDAVIMDFLMPEMDGFKALKLFKETQPDLEIILLTGNVREEERIEAKQLGAMDVFEKPADLKLLAQKIEEARARKENN